MKVIQTRKPTVRASCFRGREVPVRRGQGQEARLGEVPLYSEVKFERV